MGSDHWGYREAVSFLRTGVLGSKTGRLGFPSGVNGVSTVNLATGQRVAYPVVRDLKSGAGSVGGNKITASGVPSLV